MAPAPTPVKPTNSPVPKPAITNIQALNIETAMVSDKLILYKKIFILHNAQMDTTAQPTPKRQAVLLRESGLSGAQVAKATGLSAPTVLALHKAFKAGGWEAVDQRTRGRPRLGAQATCPANVTEAFAGLLPESAGIHSGLGSLWTTDLLAQWLSLHQSKALNARAALRRMKQWGWLPVATSTNTQTNKTRAVRIQAGTHCSPDRTLYLLWARTLRGEWLWLSLQRPPTDLDYCDFAQRLHTKIATAFELALAFPGTKYTPRLQQWLTAHSSSVALVHPTYTDQHCKAPTMTNSTTTRQPEILDKAQLTHLQRLEAESIHVMREVVASCDNSVMLYSIGKDSAVMLRLALKAFYPAKLPFPLLHVDTGWKFKDMYAFRNRMQSEHDFKLLVHQNQDGLKLGINPFTHGSQIHTDVMKTQGLKQALDQYQFDAAFGGARRDEEKSRSKERIFSFRNAQHRWDPKNQRPELWNVYNTQKNKGESLRVFPISNWTELDIWQYIRLERIPIVPLYFSQERPVVERDGSLIMVDDDRMPLYPGEVPMLKKVRFRTLGCYPLTGAVESEARTLAHIIQEMLLTKTSERHGRVIDNDSAASMEKKKQEGYF